MCVQLCALLGFLLFFFFLIISNINNNYEHLYDPLQVNEDYYDVASLNEKIAENNNSLLCIHVNIQYCRKNLDEL